MGAGSADDEPGATSGPAFDAQTLGHDVYERFYRQTAVPTLTLDVGNRKILDCNQAMLDFLDLARETVIGRPAADFLTEPEPDQALRVLALRGERTRTIRKVTTGRGPRLTEISFVPSGEEAVVFVQTHDVTDLLEANAMLERRTDELQEKTAALETLAARMAHDLRGPLATVGGFVDLLRRQPESLAGEQRDAMLERISANVRSLARMVSDMLDESTLSQGDLDATGSSAVVDLFAALRSIYDVELFAVGGRLEATTSIDRLPVPVGQVRQIVVNLVGNSVKFRALDRPLLVEIEVTADDDEVCISVQDNGTGMGDDPEALFADGARGDNTTATDGHGLGLTFSRSAAEALGGSLRAVPVDRGTRLELRLPADVADAGEPLSPFGGSYAGGLTARQLDLVLELSPTPTLLIDLAARGIVRVNRAAERVLGVPAAEILGRRAREFLEDPADGDALRADVLLEGLGRAGTLTRVRTASGLVPVEVELASIPDTTLSIAQFRPVNRDRRATPRSGEPTTSSERERRAEGTP